MNKKLIILTGGGTAGHVMPHIAILKHLYDQGWQIYYIGSRYGIEKDILSKYDIPYKGIFTGKLRRYFSFKNFIDLFKVFLGFIQSLFILIVKKPSVVFSKGGFVAVPVCFAAWVLKIPVITHESDYSPGLANKLISFIAQKILYSFEESSKFFPSKKSYYTGNPIREELLQGDKTLGYKLCGFNYNDLRPVLLVIGGSSGAKRINNILEQAVEELIKTFNIIHITGKNKKSNFTHPNYCSFEFVSEDLKHIFAITDLVISRAGANAIFEFLALQKPMLLIPLEVGSRGDQLLNAKYFEAKGWALMIKETHLSIEILINKINQLKQNSSNIRTNQKNSFSNKYTINNILNILKQYMNEI